VLKAPLPIFAFNASVLNVDFQNKLAPKQALCCFQFAQHDWMWL